MTYHVTCVKKTNLSTKNNVFYNICFFFYIDQKILIFREIDEHAYIMEMYIYNF
jgi:hypothetical protein